MPPGPKRKAPTAESSDSSVTSPKKARQIEKVTTTNNSDETSSESLSNFLRDPTWSKHLKTLFESDVFQKIEQHLNDEWKQGKEIFPPKDLIFEAFNQTPFDQVKVVILGQDPYHDNGQVSE